MPTRLPGSPTSQPTTPTPRQPGRSTTQAAGPDAATASARSRQRRCQTRSTAHRRRTTVTSQEGCASSRGGCASSRIPFDRAKLSSLLRVLPVGGLGEIGENMSVVEYDGRIVLIDCGVASRPRRCTGSTSCCRTSATYSNGATGCSMGAKDIRVWNRPSPLRRCGRSLRTTRGCGDGNAHGFRVHQTEAGVSPPQGPADARRPERASSGRRPQRLWLPGMRGEVGQRLVAACERAAGSPLRPLFAGPGAA